MFSLSLTSNSHNTVLYLQSQVAAILADILAEMHLFKWQYLEMDEVNLNHAIKVWNDRLP